MAGVLERDGSRWVTGNSTSGTRPRPSTRGDRPHVEPADVDCQPRGDVNGGRKGYAGSAAATTALRSLITGSQAD